MITLNTLGLPLSARWAAAWSAGRTETSYAEIWASEINGFVKKKSLLVTGGSYTVDGTADTLRRCTLATVAPDETYVPGITPDYYWPTGSELRLFTGLVYPDETTEFVSAGVYRLSKPRVSEDGETGLLSVSFNGFDRSKVVADNRFAKEYVITDGANVGTLIKAIVTDRLGGNVNFKFKFKFEPTTQTVAAGVLEAGSQSNPWKDCTTLAATANMQLYFDVAGDLVLRAITDPAANGVQATYSEDKDCTILKLDRGLDEEQGYSGVIVRNSNANANPVYAEAWDMDPSSPTYVNTFGYKPYFIDTQFLPNKPDGGINQPLADQIAKSQLMLVKGVIEEVSMNVSGNPAHEQNDWIAIKRLKAGINNNYLLDSYVRSVGATGVMDMVTRKRRAA